MMPKLDGLSVLKAIREQKNTVPVMLLTAKSEVDDKVAGLDRGADDYITVRMPQATAAFRSARQTPLLSLSTTTEFALINSSSIPSLFRAKNTCPGKR